MEVKYEQLQRADTAERVGRAVAILRAAGKRARGETEPEAEVRGGEAEARAGVVRA